MQMVLIFQNQMNKNNDFLWMPLNHMEMNPENYTGPEKQCKLYWSDPARIWTETTNL